MTIDAMLEAARDFDPDGYSREALRSMYNGSRPLRIRVMSAMAVAADYPVEGDQYFRLAVVRYLLDETLHGTEGAVTNLDALKTTDQVTIDPEELKWIPVGRRKEAIREAAKKSRKPRRRA